MTELDALRAEIAALWVALRQVNENQLALNANVHRLSHRLMIQEAVTAAEELDQPKGLH